ncbi:MAG: acyl-CoA reductase [Flavobacteriales bacterium]|jgi:hypothetical protein|nr:acyl-CoA reductase [Flavobacteriales bacterium]
MTATQEIRAFVLLGQFLGQFQSNGTQNEHLKELNEIFYEDFLRIINTHVHYNGWFSKATIQLAIENTTPLLSQDTLENWTNQYKRNDTSQKVLVIYPSNLPLVEFHDFITVLLSGNTYIGKGSSQNNRILPFLSKILIFLEEDFGDRIIFTEAPIKDFDMAIATGSNNSARHFEYYFKGKPSIIRSNRTSIAILDGSETEEELENLGKDISQYFGRGCRSITKLYLPKDFDINAVIKGVFPFSDMVNNNKYANNYDYHRAVMMMNQEPFLDNGFMLFKENEAIQTPVSVINYEFYESKIELEQKIKNLSEEVQCIVSKDTQWSSLTLGEAQKPTLEDYADGIDTFAFLTNQK